MLSYREIINLSTALENELQQLDKRFIEFIPLIRMHLYLSQRSPAGNSSDRIDKKRSLQQRVIALTESAVKVMGACWKGLACDQLFVAPALSRNAPVENGLASKHLDSLKSRFEGSRDCVWEFAPLPLGMSKKPSLADCVTVVSRFLEAALPASKRVKSIKGIIHRGVCQAPERPDWDLNALTKFLSLYEIQRSIYSVIFKRSSLVRAYFICYYGSVPFPILAALNDRNIETIEYQHGIQSNVQPMYTQWEHLETLPKCMPRRMLLWDNVAVKRINQWGVRLGVQTEQIGNLWYSTNGYAPLPKPATTSILVALQGFPDFFNFEVLKVMAKTTELEWVFREHPIAVLSAPQREELYRHNPGLTIMRSTEESLEASIERCSICITGFSTVGLEALLCKRTTIFTHPNAREGLSEYIDGQQCFFADTEDAITRVIQACSSGS